MRSSISLSLLLSSIAAAREIPANLQSFYDAHINGACINPVSIAYDSGQGTADTVYCKDDASGAVYLKDERNGYADVDIDCDGLNADKGDCFNDPSGQPQTAFKHLVQAYGIDDLDSHIHTFIVLGNDNSPEEGDGGEAFDPTSVGIQPLSVVAIVCNDKLLYGVWGDINGGKVTGEASLSIGQMCFPNEGINGNTGHAEHDVLYVAFTGEEAVPGPSANWKAATREEFEESLTEVGDRLVAGLGGATSRLSEGGCETRLRKGTMSSCKSHILS